MADGEYEIVTNVKARSGVWRHFGLVRYKDTRTFEDHVAVCRHCRQFVKSAGGTTNLTSHLRRHHPAVLPPMSLGAIVPPLAVGVPTTATSSPRPAYRSTPRPAYRSSLFTKPKIGNAGTSIRVRKVSEEYPNIVIKDVGIPNKDIKDVRPKIVVKAVRTLSDVTQEVCPASVDLGNPVKTESKYEV